ncbi:MAG: SDR family NAD(P)-dependent oxidoreductase [Halioglobus sp.]|nr:SDR family NAD(P)-dependent oxidoreductase [Halioglobus sp.]
MKDFRNKLVCITGAGSGIGRETALAFARAGARVVVTDLQDETAAQTKDRILASGGHAVHYAVDVTDATAMQQLATPLLRTLPRTTRQQSVMVIPGFLGDDRGNEDILATPPPVPTTAIYTRAEGLVNWRTLLQAGDNHAVRNIEVPGTHIGLNRNAAVWYWVAKKLAA